MAARASGVPPSTRRCVGEAAEQAHAGAEAANPTSSSRSSGGRDPAQQVGGGDCDEDEREDETAPVEAVFADLAEDQEDEDAVDE